MGQQLGQALPEKPVILWGILVLHGAPPRVDNHRYSSAIMMRDRRAVNTEAKN
jgi:hypothetical protein